MAGVDGSSRRRVGRGSAPAWSPDGARIALDSVRGDQQSIYVLDLRSGRERLVLRRALDPAWRPSSK